MCLLYTDLPSLAPWLLLIKEQTRYPRRRGAPEKLPAPKEVAHHMLLTQWEEELPFVSG